MSVHLKGVVLGDSSTGKSSFLQAISSDKSNLQVETIDPSTKTSIIFHLEESSKMPNSLSHTPCIFLLYSLVNYNTFASVKENWVPKAMAAIKNENSFIIIIGTHNDLSNKREVDAQEAEEFATSNGVFHMEISSTKRRNIELTLKVMRIRASYLLKKHPEIGEPQYENDVVNISSPRSSMVQFGETYKHIDMLEEFSLSQFESETNLKPEHAFNRCQAISDIPLPFND